MTNSKAPWLTRGGAIALMAAAAIALAACSGGGGLNEDEAAGLQQELKEAKAEAAAALAARVTAEAEAARMAASKRLRREAVAEKTRQKRQKTAADAARDAAVARRRDGSERRPQDAAAAAQEAAAALVVAAQQKAKADQKEAEDERDAAVMPRPPLDASSGWLWRRRRPRSNGAKKPRRSAIGPSRWPKMRASRSTAGARMRVGLGLATEPDAAMTVEPLYNAARIASLPTYSTFVNPTTGSLSGWRKTAFGTSDRTLTASKVFGCRRPRSARSGQRLQRGIQGQYQLQGRTVVAPFEHRRCQPSHRSKASMVVGAHSGATGRDMTWSGHRLSRGRAPADLILHSDRPGPYKEAIHDRLGYGQDTNG